jgi:UDP-N-acetylglucosamine--N-acetylmuramyl-(pentapeptide) pyrophosphoryl-undecaprenol N-acetylglucosamine transferase
VYPALAVHNALFKEKPDLETLWVGGEGGLEAGLIERTGLQFKTIPAAGIHGIGLKQLPRNLLQIIRGMGASLRILMEFKPDVLFYTGGFVAVPMAFVGWRKKSILYVPDIEPGMALKAISYFAKRITVTADESRKYFNRQGRIVVTGYPTRPELAHWSREDARRKFGLTSSPPVLLVFGGSKGAHSINVALLEHLPALLAKVQIIHISGEGDWQTVSAKRQSLTATQANRYHAYPYLHEEMGAALAVADLAVSRAGASALGEFPLFGLPAVLVPYPYAWRYQKVNADFLGQRGAAVVLNDNRVSEELYKMVSTLLDNPLKLDAMRKAMRELAHPQAAHSIAAQLAEMAGA